MTKWPAKKSIEEVLEKLELSPELYSRAVPKNAPLPDLVKRDMCAEFIVYKREKGLNQRELAQKLEIGEALVSKILRYQFDEFTIDRLIKYLEKLGIKYEFRRVA